MKNIKKKKGIYNQKYQGKQKKRISWKKKGKIKNIYAIYKNTKIYIKYNTTYMKKEIYIKYITIYNDNVYIFTYKHFDTWYRDIQFIFNIILKKGKIKNTKIFIEIIWFLVKLIIIESRKKLSKEKLLPLPSRFSLSTKCLRCSDHVLSRFTEDGTGLGRCWTNNVRDVPNMIARSMVHHFLGGWSESHDRGWSRM